MDKLEQYIIHFGDLESGTYHFDFKMDDSFFESIGTNLYNNANMNIHVVMHKNASTLSFDLEADGSMNSECYRCLADSKMILKGNAEKYFIASIGGDSESDSTDEIIVLSPTEQKINIANQLFDFFHSIVPANFIACEANNEPELCDTEVLNKLQNVKQTEEKQDLRWESLLKLKNKFTNN